MRARLQDLSPSAVAAWLKRKRGSRRGATKTKAKQQRRRGRGKALDQDTTAVAGAPPVVCDTTAVAVFTPGTPPVASGAGPLGETVAALAALPCGLSSAVADDSLVCSICTEVCVCRSRHLVLALSSDPCRLTHASSGAALPCQRSLVPTHLLRHLPVHLGEEKRAQRAGAVPAVPDAAGVPGARRGRSCPPGGRVGDLHLRLPRRSGPRTRPWGHVHAFGHRVRGCGRPRGDSRWA